MFTCSQTIDTMGDNFLFSGGKRIGHRPGSLVDNVEKVRCPDESEAPAHPNPLSQEASEALSHPVLCLLRGRSSPGFYVVSLVSQPRIDRNGMYLYLYVLCVYISKKNKMSPWYRKNASDVEIYFSGGLQQK